MARSAVVTLRVAPSVKKDAEALFSDLGLSLSDAVNVFLHKSLMVGGLPFDVKEEQPNAETIAAMQEANDILNGKKKAKVYSSVDELFDDLNHETAKVTQTK